MNNKITLNDEVIKYYDELLSNIKKDFANGQHQKAVERLQEELEQTYIPFEYQQIFEHELHLLQTEYRYLQIDEKIKKLPQDKMMEQIIANNKFNVYLLDYFLQLFHNQLTDKDYFVIGEWLKSTILDNTQKFYVLDSLAHFNIDKDFIFYNHLVQDDVVLNTLNFHDHENFKNYNITLDIIEKTLFKDPIVTKFAEDLLNAVTTHYFPSFIFNDPENLAKIILKIINNSMNFVQLDLADLSEDERKVYKIFLDLQSSESI